MRIRFSQQTIDEAATVRNNHPGKVGLTLSAMVFEREANHQIREAERPTFEIGKRYALKKEAYWSSKWIEILHIRDGVAFGRCEKFAGEDFSVGLGNLIPEHSPMTTMFI